jgi:hypothetical protein
VVRTASISELYLRGKDPQHWLKIMEFLYNSQKSYLNNILMLKINVEKRSGESLSHFALRLQLHQNNAAPWGSGIGIQ